MQKEKKKLSYKHLEELSSSKLDISAVKDFLTAKVCGKDLMRVCRNVSKWNWKPWMLMKASFA